MRRELHHSGTVLSFCRRIVAILALSALSFAGHADAQDGGMEITDFKAQLEHHPPPNETKIKTLLEGDKARYVGNEKVLLLTDAKVTTFRTNGTVEMVANTPHCMFDRERQIVSSPEALRVQSGDGKFLLEGKGFLLDQTNSLLWISNDVHTVSQEELHGMRQTIDTDEPARIGGPVEVFADNLFYDRHAGVAVYRGHVRAAGTNLQLTAESLKLEAFPEDRSLKSIDAESNVVIDYGGIHAVCEKAFYDATGDEMVLTGNPSWKMGQREGRGDRLNLDRANGVFQTTGHAYLKLPTGADATNFFAGADSGRSTAAATNSFIEVTCDTYELRTNAAVFREHVEAVKHANNQPAGKITCGLMTIHYSDSNRVQSAIAEKNVLVEQNDGSISAERAVFSGTNSIAEFTGNPSWRFGERQGSADRLMVNAARNELQADGRAKVTLPANESGMAGLAIGSTNAVAADTGKEFVKISADAYTLQPYAGEFRGDVRVDAAQFDLASGKLTFSRSQPAEEKFERAEAKENVVMNVPMNGEPTHATAGRVLYTYGVTNSVTNEFVTLTEHVKVESAKGTLTGEPLIWNRRENTWRGSNLSMLGTNAMNLLGGSERTETNSPGNK